MLWLTTTLLSRGARALVVAITMLPVLVVVILSTPAWVVWPWLSTNRRESVHRMVDQLTQWTRDVLSHTAPLTVDHPGLGPSLAKAAATNSNPEVLRGNKKTTSTWRRPTS
jgi:hypothetical protein